MQGRMLFAATVCAFLLAYTVVVLGAFVRLSDAGLGCPDWPGCYGRMLVPAGDHDVSAPYTGVTVHQGKAWKEMIHRYAAGTLGTLIFVIALLAWRQQRRAVSRGVASLLAALVVVQALLGMWTVTWLLKPVIVTAHLLGGMTILALLFWLVISQLFIFKNQDTDRGLRPWVVMALVVLLCQIFLGGWTSANYSALICPDFPTCRGGAWFPPLNFSEAFTLWRGLGINYDGGVLDAAGRTAIHVSHRLGALVTFFMLTAAAVRALRSRISTVRKLGLALFVVLLIQIGLGISNVVFVLPMPTAVAHNGVAALLLLTLVALLYLSRPKEMSLKQPR
jgi:cytochrome c oxidase assembly protein subunit 15